MCISENVKNRLNRMSRKNFFNDICIEEERYNLLSHLKIQV